MTTDDVREALDADEEDYEPEKTCALCRRDDVYEESQPHNDNGDRCGLASADAAKAAKVDVRPCPLCGQRPHRPVTDAPTRPQSEGGVWGSYVAYLAQLESAVKAIGPVTNAEEEVSRLEQVADHRAAEREREQAVEPVARLIHSRAPHIYEDDTGAWMDLARDALRTAAREARS